MALFSYKVLPLKPPVVQIALESGDVPLNLLNWQEPASGVNFSGQAMFRIFEKQYKNLLDNLRGQETDMRTMVEAQAYDLANNRLYLSELHHEQAGDAGEAAIDTLREKFAEMGHRLEERPRKATIHLDQDAAGNYLTVNGAGASIAALNLLNAVNAPVDSFIPDPATGRFRVMLRNGSDPVQAAQKLSSNGSLHVLNHTPERVLGRKAEIATAQPFVRSGHRAIEIHHTRGDFSDVAEIVQSTVPGGNGAFLARGTKDDQKSLLKKLSPHFATLDEEALSEGGKAKPREKVGAPNVKLIEDVAEVSPKVVVASNASDVTRVKLQSSPRYTEQNLELAKRVVLKKSALTPVQQGGVAFLLGRKGAILADETGGGKTMTAGVASNLKTPPGRKTLIVCPPGLIQQWIHELDQFVPIENGKPLLPENELPAWLMRLGKDERASILPAWKRVSERFVFLPESTLQSGVEVSRRKLTVDKERDSSTMSHNAFETLQSVLKEPISSLIVDEGQGLRVAGNKFELLNAIASGKLKGVEAKMNNVIISTATPLHRDAPDLYPMLVLLGVKKYAKMGRDEFCRECCQRKLVVRDGTVDFALPNPPYGYGMLKEEQLPEITAHLSELMISRTKEEIAPERVRKKVIISPVPYAPSAELGVAIKGMTQGGELVQLSAGDAEKLNKEGSSVAKRQLLANAKTDSTVEDVKKHLAENGTDRRLTVFTQFVETAKMISDKLKAAGIPNHELSSRNKESADGSSHSTKQSLISDYIEDKDSHAIIMTIGAGGTGINGLHRVSTDVFVNDFSAVAGAMVQAEGRNWRVEDAPLPPDARPATFHYKVANHPLDLRDYQELIDRRHDQTFIVQQGMIQAMDSPEVVATRQMEAARFRERILNRVGIKAGEPFIDTTYLTSREMLALAEREEERRQDLDPRECIDVADTWPGLEPVAKPSQKAKPSEIVRIKQGREY